MWEVNNIYETGELSVATLDKFSKLSEVKHQTRPHSGGNALEIYVSMHFSRKLLSRVNLQNCGYISLPSSFNIVFIAHDVSIVTVLLQCFVILNCVCQLVLYLMV